MVIFWVFRVVFWAPTRDWGCFSFKFDFLLVSGVHYPKIITNRDRNNYLACGSLVRRFQSVQQASFPYASYTGTTQQIFVLKDHLIPTRTIKEGTFWMFLCLYVCMSATSRSNISETKEVYEIFDLQVADIHTYIQNSTWTDNKGHLKLSAHEPVI